MLEIPVVPYCRPPPICVYKCLNIYTHIGLYIDRQKSIKLVPSPLSGMATRWRLPKS